MAWPAAGQSILSNGDFEIYDTLPSGPAQIYRATGWNNVNLHYTGMYYGSPDYFNTDARLLDMGQMGAISGKGQAGFITYHIIRNFREYLSAKLDTNMVPGKFYQVSFYLSNGRETYGSSSTNNIGVCFSASPLNQKGWNPIDAEPQLEIKKWAELKDEWRKYTFNLQATDRYRYITIGNFRNDSLTLTFSRATAYYFIDKIEVIPFRNIRITGDTEICRGNTTVLHGAGSTIYNWAESTNPGHIISHDTILSVTPQKTTTYYLYSKNFQDTAVFTVHVTEPAVFDLGKDTIVCGDEKLNLLVKETNVACLWSNGKTGPEITIIAPGKYSVIVKRGSCFTYDTICVSYSPVPEVSLGRDSTLCGEGPVVLKSSIPQKKYLWSTGDTASSISVAKSGKYWLTVYNDNCFATDTIDLTFNPYPEIRLPHDTVLCGDEFISLDVSGNGRTFLWSTGETVAGIQVRHPGKYTVTVWEKSCPATASTYVRAIPLPVVDLGSDTIFCGPLKTWLDAGEGANYQWLPGGEQSRKLLVTAYGTYKVMVQSAAGCWGMNSIILRERCLPQIWAPDAFSPGNDSLNEFFRPACNWVEDYQLSIFNRWGELLFQSNDPEKGWNGCFNGAPCPEGVYIWSINYKGYTESKTITGTTSLIRQKKP